MTIDHDGKTPVYLQLAAILREGIERGDYPPGRKLPSETTLTQEYGLAREPCASRRASSPTRAWSRSSRAAASSSPSGPDGERKPFVGSVGVTVADQHKRETVLPAGMRATA